MAMHPDQLAVTAETVRDLVDRQFPDWRDLPVTGVRSQGTVNALFRLGDALVARLPLVPRGDLIPGNVLVAGGRLAGVIDVGGLGAADPALDLVAAWHLLDPDPREAFRAALGCGDLEWARGAAWAFEQAIGVVWYYAQTNPAMSEMGRRTLQRIAATF